ncbi:MAG: helix-turn-helix domain-containing protein [Gaiellales bacterium]
MIRDTLLLERVDQAAALLQPARIDVLRQLAEPRSCPPVAAALGLTTPRVHYHVKVLERAGLVERVAERRVRALVEGVYQAAARSYWLSSSLVGRLGGGRAARSAGGHEYLFGLAEELQADLGHLDRPEATFGITAEIDLPADRRAEFLSEVQSAVTAIAERYGGSDGADRATYRLRVACYPTPPLPGGTT